MSTASPLRISIINIISASLPAWFSPRRGSKASAMKRAASKSVDCINIDNSSLTSLHTAVADDDDDDDDTNTNTVIVALSTLSWRPETF